MVPAPTQHKIFTHYYHGVTRELLSEVLISAPHRPGQPPPNLIRKQYAAIWDTGATNTNITPKVAQECGLKPTGMAQLAGVHGTKIVNTYLVNVVLRNDVEVGLVRVTEVDTVGEGADVLIGMDMITLGDFAVSTSEGRTVFSFRIPSAGHIDFLPPANRPQLPSPSSPPNLPPGPPKVGRNDPCPCGSGKKYKKCHGANT